MTNTTTERRRAPRAIALALAAGIAVSMAGALPAAAHTQVSPAAPEPGSTVTTGPVTVALETTEPILESGQKSIIVKGPGDEERYFGDGCTEVTNGTTLSAEMTLGAPGEYTVVWTLVAEDGHTQSSNDFEPFTFTWQPDEGQQSAEGSPSVPTCGDESSSGETGDEESSDAGSSDEASGSESQGDEPADNDASAADGGDIAWLIAAAGIVFIAAAAVVMIAVRRKMLADDAEDAAADDDAAAPDDTSRSGPPATS
ncbi:copper resistance CopC family protein [Paramicrobacterium agarici]|uniref:copper resistance CopC family protein n=1 Tax=Paramicrobacterium agarici TaxID=630514 RepID=UPI0011549E3B|nr:copper resistance protein CopC [Microbacterium agarici]TQO23433.1 methionine-rich copper-binding protein CopC [Microbacterium agarici]